MQRPLYYAWNKETGETYPVSSWREGWSEDRDQARVAMTEMLIPDAWIGKENRGHDYIWVSTVFLALDHQYGDGVPILFETMIFGMPSDHELDDYTERYATAAEARKGHDEAVTLVGEAVRASTTPQEAKKP